MITRAFLLAALLGACGGDDAGSTRAAEATGSEAPVSGTAVAAPAAVRDFCGSPDEARIRAAHPEIPACFNRAFTYLEARVGGHDLLVLAREADPCCTDVPSPATDAGPSVYVDGRAREAFDPIAVGAAPADASEAMALLSAELLRLLVVRPVVDEVGVTALRRAWPEAGPAIERTSVGLTRDGATWRLRALAEARESERGIACRFLSVWDAEVDAAGVRATRARRYASGTAMGAPCDGEPLPG